VAGNATGLIFGIRVETYDSPEHEAARQTVNEWIRTSGSFDEIIDLDAVVQDPEDPAALLRPYDSGDRLHPSVAGYEAMAEAIDLGLFAE
jgi:lysophospholipase L1-like esterase